MNAPVNSVLRVAIRRFSVLYKLNPKMENLFACLILRSPPKELRELIHSRIVRGSRVEEVHTMPKCIECGTPIHSG